MNSRPENIFNQGGNELLSLKEDRKEMDFLLSSSNKLGIPIKNNILDDLNIETLNNVPIQYLKRMNFVPLYMENGTLVVAVNDPSKFQAVDELAMKMRASSSRMVLSPTSEIQSAINLLFDQSSEDTEKMVQDLEDYRSDDNVFSELEELEDLMDVTHEAPIIRLVNVILTQALRRMASDIHIESYERHIKVRFRIDGILYEVFSIPKRFQAHIVSRIKVMANLDIAEKRLPQDGRIKIMVANKTVDIRVSIIPMAFGERIVLRLLDKSISLLGLADMGLVETRLKRFERLINKNNGILLVTGPTGSGKTTTLYAVLNSINSTEKNIITIEDPIEYELKGIGQIQVNQKTELSFARAIRSILRHDPDIIMVGEIRDRETADIAIQASLTGHLVFSTLHTNDAASALTRLVDMGIEPFLIASSLLAVEAQRLVRKICRDCGEVDHINKAIIDSLNLPQDMSFFRGKGCPSCFDSGYRGRTGIFELLEVENNIRGLVTSGADSVTIKEVAMKKGMMTLFEDGLEKTRKGITTLDEVMRVTQE